MDDDSFVVVNKSDLAGNMEDLERLSKDWITRFNHDYKLDINETENKLIFSVKTDENISFYVVCPDQEEKLVKCISLLQNLFHMIDM